jgi:hypothetical protein
VATLAEDVGNGLLGLCIGPNGPIVVAYGDRSVVEIADDGTRRVLLTTEPPWAPTDVTFHHEAIYVVEVAMSDDWKGPRIRTMVLGQKPRTLLSIEHVPRGLPVRLFLVLFVVAAIGVAVGVILVLALVIRRLGRLSGNRRKPHPTSA